MSGEVEERLNHLEERIAILTGETNLAIRYEGTKPLRATNGAGAYDLRAEFEEDEIAIQPNTVAKIRTNLKTAIPSGYVGLVCSRSGLGVRKLNLINRPAVIDSDFRGEWVVFMHNEDVLPITVKRGDRVAQVVIVRAFEVEWVEGGLDETERGEGGFGSSGR